LFVVKVSSNRVFLSKSFGAVLSSVYLYLLFVMSKKSALPSCQSLQGKGTLIGADDQLFSGAWQSYIHMQNCNIDLF